MLYQNEFISMSLELNLFFLRIMKEHSFFIETSFTPKDARLAAEVRVYKQEFERLLSEATDLANGKISQHAINSQQFATQYTVDAEKLTSFYSGMPINTNLTQRQLKLITGNQHHPDTEHRVDSINRRALRLTSNFSEFKNRLFQSIISCRTFTNNYPHMIKHMLDEADYYVDMLEDLVNRRPFLNEKDIVQKQIFWNHKMADHSKFIAGLLDPTEEVLIKTARMFADEFDKLEDEAKLSMGTSDTDEVTEASINGTERLRAFKTAGTEGLINCKIKSVIIPLLADHVLREANHYICVLGRCGTQSLT